MWFDLFCVINAVLLHFVTANGQNDPVGSIIEAHDCSREGSTEFTTLDVTQVLSCDSDNKDIGTWHPAPVQVLQRRVTRKVVVNRCFVEKQR